MATDLNSSFNEHFMSINSKLKKRFMRKPNINEAREEFTALGVQCQMCEQHTFAGHAFVGAAKCLAATGNIFGEASQYITAGRQYIIAEKKLRILQFATSNRENLEAAIGCYNIAASKYPPNCVLKVKVYLELANHLNCLCLQREALNYYEQAYMAASKEDSLRRICMENIISLQINIGKFDLALEAANKLCDETFDIPEDILIEINVTRILLTLLLEPCEEQQPASLKKLFEDLMSGSDDLLFHADLKMKLQSIVISCLDNDTGALIRIASDACFILSEQQVNILDRLTNKMRDKCFIVV